MVSLSNLILLSFYMCYFFFKKKINHKVVFPERYFRRKELSETLDFKKDTDDQESQHESEQDFSQGPCPTVRQKLWDILEKPGSSTAARIFGVISIIFVAVSIVNMALMSAELSWLNLQLLEILEYVCISWFTGEFLLRFLCVKDRCRFLRKVPNIIDLLAILPFYITLLVESLSGSHTTQELENVGRLVQVLRLLRALRMLKLGRHSTGIHISMVSFNFSLLQADLCEFVDNLVYKVSYMAARTVVMRKPILRPSPQKNQTNKKNLCK